VTVAGTWQCGRCDTVNEVGVPTCMACKQEPEALILPAPPPRPRTAVAPPPRPGTRVPPAPPPGGLRADRPWNGMASMALVFALLGICTHGLTGIPAVIVALTAIGEIRRSGEYGWGAAIAALVLGAVELFVFLHPLSGWLA
jgi:Domain of unknown function (DUF4190)